MKPRITHFPSRGDAPVSVRTFPSTNCHFQSTGADLNARGAISPQALELRRFRDLSNDFSRTEATRSYVSEAIAFALITLVSIWPIILMTRELTRMLR